MYDFELNILFHACLENIECEHLINYYITMKKTSPCVHGEYNLLLTVPGLKKSSEWGSFIIKQVFSAVIPA